jgi:predicted GNAT superfamily acetyltransferase
MTNLIDITDLTDADLDALLGLDDETAAEAAKVAADRRAIAAIVAPVARRTYGTTRTEARDCTAAEDAYYAEMDNS